MSRQTALFSYLQLMVKSKVDTDDQTSTTVYLNEEPPPVLPMIARLTDITEPSNQYHGGV